MKKYNFLLDINYNETKDWLDEFKYIIERNGFKRAKFIIKNLIIKYNFLNKYEKLFLDKKSNYINSIDKSEEINYPGDIKIEDKIESYVKWNSVAIVIKAYKKNLDLGGHISSYLSCATLYEVCFNHFFISKENNNSNGDLIYFQGHISPGIYSRSFIEKRIEKDKLDNFRQEVNGNGLSSYPHPRLMDNYWEFPTVSMGLGAISSIYQARFLKYLHNRKIQDTSKRTVYTFLGDGEMDEPESRGALHIASRDNLDNLIFIINCNLQRLDGPVYGNGKIIFELEKVFKGYDWHVIKVIHSSKWDNLFKNDKSGLLIKLFNEINDGNLQNLMSKDPSYIRNNFFGKFKETKKLVENMTDEEISELSFGGHDKEKIFFAINEAKKINKPVVILIQSIKGYGIKYISSKNISHQVKNVNENSIKEFRNFLNLNDIISDKVINDLPYISFSENSLEMNYIKERRKKLNGYIPIRRKVSDSIIDIPNINDFEIFFKEQIKPISTTIAFSKILLFLLRNNSISKYIVPIVADEARTFGLEFLFKKIGIYNPLGQKYIPQDNESILSYTESANGQILQEGISELGASCSWLAAATSYSTNNINMIPFYVYYSIFGFQRVGDLYWAAGDQLAKGFLIGATSGRTTLNGEGLQHQDGHSHIQSSVVPSCISYNPAYAYELAVIISNGLNEMYGKNKKNIYYYITVSNENYCMPKLPDNPNIIEGICKGIYLLKKTKDENVKIQLLGSGSIINNIIKASEILLKEYKICSYIYSVTSFTELFRDGNNCTRWNLLNSDKKSKLPYLSKILLDIPTVCSIDYVKLYAEQIRAFVPNKYYYVLGTDGYGLSDSRENLRDYFEIDEKYIVLSSLYILYKSNNIKYDILYNYTKKAKININKINPSLK